MVSKTGFIVFSNISYEHNYYSSYGPFKRNCTVVIVYITDFREFADYIIELELSFLLETPNDIFKLYLNVQRFHENEHPD